MQASLDVEVKGRAEALKLKKKLEADVNDLELQVDLLTKNNAELGKSVKKMQQQIKVQPRQCSKRLIVPQQKFVTAVLPRSQELQAQLEEEVRSHEERREEQAAMERRCLLLVSEGEETCAALESAERARKALETELQEANEKYSDLNNQVSQAAETRRPFPAEARVLIDSRRRCFVAVSISSGWEEESGGGPPGSAAGARGAAGGAERIRGQVQEGRLGGETR